MKLFHVDAFTDRAFSGNPAAVVLSEAPLAAEWMQRFAAEMSLSETAFVWPEGDGHRLRWFTPVLEIELCGHATLATAHVLGTERARFHTLSGLLTTVKSRDGITLDFPAEIATPLAEVPRALVDGLRVPLVSAWAAKHRYLVEVESVAAVQPDFGLLATLPKRGVIVTCASREHDFVSRYFAPAAGVPEDPVTGSAHCTLGPFWAARLGRTTLSAYQASARGGALRVEVAGDRVLLTGRAVTITRGEIDRHSYER